MVRVRLLGGLRVEHDGRPVELPAARNARLLLAALAAERRPHGRSELAGRLWPDYREDSARASLRNALAQLRSALGPIADAVVVADRDEVALGAGVRTDLEDLDAALARREVEDVARRCAEGLLAGYDEDWVHGLRRALEDRVARSLADAAAAAEAAGDAAAAVRLTRLQAELEPLSESAHRDLMRRMAAAGDRGAALAAYEHLTARLAAELRVAPSAETRRLVAELRSDATAGPPPAAPAAMPVIRSGVRYARSGDHAIAYQRFGSGSGDLLVVPGWASNLDELWTLPSLGGLFTRLGTLARCVVFDKRGTGLSDRDTRFGSLEERAGDIRAVMDAAGLGRATIFAYSESAALAIVFAASHPERVERLVLYSAYARLLAAPDYPPGLPPDLVTAFIDHVQSDWGRGTVSRVSFQGVPHTEAATQLLARWERSLCTPTMAAHILRSNADIDVRSLLASIRAPSLVLHSAGDPVSPAAQGRWVADHIPDARYVEGDADYHLPWQGETAWFLDPLADFLAAPRTPPPGPRPVLATLVCLRGRPDVAAVVAAHGGEVLVSAGAETVALLQAPSSGVACAVAACATGASAGLHVGEIDRSAPALDADPVAGARAAADAANPGEAVVTRQVRDLVVGEDVRFAARDGGDLFRVVR